MADTMTTKAPERTLMPVERRDKRRLDTLTILDDPAWPGDGAEVGSLAAAARWWCLGAAILLAFPRQYVAMAIALLLALAFAAVHARAKKKAAAAPVRSLAR